MRRPKFENPGIRIESLPPDWITTNPRLSPWPAQQSERGIPHIALPCPTSLGSQAPTGCEVRLQRQILPLLFMSLVTRYAMAGFGCPQRAMISVIRYGLLTSRQSGPARAHRPNSQQPDGLMKSLKHARYRLCRRCAAVSHSCLKRVMTDWSNGLYACDFLLGVENEGKFL